ncbi:hypothetical protein GE21DRAFT_1220846, partial [Neurospora crassa]
VYRLLIIDGFNNYYNIEVKEYINTFNIILIVLPPYSTYIIQPLNVGVFSFLKIHY